MSNSEYRYNSNFYYPVCIAVLIAALALFILLPNSALAEGEWRGLVPCGGSGQPCSTCHFAVLLNNLTRFGVEKLALPLGAVMIVVAGFYYAFSGGDEKKITAAKNTLKNAALGIFIVLVAWFAVDTAIKTLVGAPDANKFRFALGPWNNPFEDQSACSPGGSIAVTAPQNAREPEPAIRSVGATVANIFGTIVLAASVIVILISAFRFTTAGGNTDTIGEARQMLIYGLVGVGVALLAYVLPGLTQTLLR